MQEKTKKKLRAIYRRLFRQEQIDLGKIKFLESRGITLYF
jgi:hypothetical protein